MVDSIDWIEVSAWAAMITASGAVVAIWLGNRHASITRSMDLLLRMESKFDSDRMKALRRRAASGFLEGKLVDESYYVLDFFEEAGLLLKMKAIHEELLFESFYHSILAYWFTARRHILELRQDNKELYDHFEFLAKRDLAYASRKTKENTARMEDESHWRYFIERETHAS